MKPTVTPVPSPNRLLEKRNAQGRHVPSPQAGWGDVVPQRDVCCPTVPFVTWNATDGTWNAFPCFGQRLGFMRPSI